MLLGPKEMQLVCDVPTRWNSAADMLEGYLKLMSAIYGAFTSKEIKTRESELNTLNETDTKLAEEILNCFLPLKHNTDAVKYGKDVIWLYYDPADTASYENNTIYLVYLCRIFVQRIQ